MDGWLLSRCIVESDLESLHLEIYRVEHDRGLQVWSGQDLRKIWFFTCKRYKVLTTVTHNSGGSGDGVGPTVDAEIRFHWLRIQSYHRWYSLGLG